MSGTRRLERASVGCALLFASVLAATGAALPAAGAGVPTMPRCLGKQATIVGQGNVGGTAHADVIVSGSGVDRISAGGGNDRICTAGSDDVIEGGTGSDRIDAGRGDDEVIGGNGSDLVLGGPGADTVFGKRGNDSLDGGPGGDFLDSGLGDDTLDGGAGAGDQVIGGVGNDHVSGGPGAGDVLEGDLGRDLVDGGPAAHDTASYALAGSGQIFLDGMGVEVDLGAGTANGDGDDTLRGIEDVVGTPFADTIAGDAQPNSLYGGSGIDDLMGVGNGDAAFGGTGPDLCRAVAVADSCELEAPPGYKAISEVALQPFLDKEKPPPTFAVDLAGGPRAGALSGRVEYGTNLYEKQEIQVHASFFEGAWIVTEEGLPMSAGDGCALLGLEIARCPIASNPAGLFLDGGEGGDLLAVEPSVPATASARLIGGNGVDTLIGGAGDDSLDGTIGNVWGDAVYGGPGDDALTNGAVLDGDGGSDLLIALPCGETIEGGAGVDSVSFARASQGVEATLGGSAGTAPYDGFGGGCPTEHGGQPASRIDGSVESIEGSAHDDVLRGDGGRNIILGRGGDDEVHGAGGTDFLVGGEGVDSLFGEGGADRLYARDGRRDRAIDCRSTGPGSQTRRDDSAARGDVVFADPNDPSARHCRTASQRAGKASDSAS
ncbi:MAG TPA: calcium-binding protein [Solirubrobacterales bacterium]|jgi:Ca2+-binding RTX toxin-like protein|nr:calcium-binding protein [Solirubrobacterales bacterium]